jgi:hypothetical protein
MAINGIGGSGFNPYANGVSQQRGVATTGTPGTTNTGTAHQHELPVANTSNTVATKSIAEAIKSDASSRAAQVNSAQAPEGVDQELWSVLSKEERSFFVKAGAMGPLTYGRFTTQQTPQSVATPMMRGGRLDIKA